MGGLPNALWNVSQAPSDIGCLPQPTQIISVISQMFQLFFLSGHCYPDTQTTERLKKKERELQTNSPYEHRYKNSQQNIWKSNFKKHQNNQPP